MRTIENYTISKGIAVLPGPRTSFLDHLIPLCHTWNIPLLCTDPWVLTCAELYYPKTSVLFAGDQENFQQILSQYQTFVTVEPCRLHESCFRFGDFLYKGEARTVAGFHGNPDKFRNEYWIERYVDEDVVLIYGQQLIDYFKEKRVWRRLKNPIWIGNLRKKFYLSHRSFFDNVVKPFLFKKRDRTLFFAPTWSYPDFPDLYRDVLEALPPCYQMMVKLHPYMYRLFPEEIAFLKQKYRGVENLLFLDEIPLIYPLIEKTDFYLGDYSSVAYDFLSLNRPLFFLGKKECRWGKRIDCIGNLFSMVEEQDALSSERKKGYAYAYEVQ